MKSAMQILEWSRDDLVVTEYDIHIAAFVCMSQYEGMRFLIPPSAFIRRPRNLKRGPYRMARRLFLALGCEVPDIPVPGSGQPRHMFPALQLAWCRMKEAGD